MRLWILILGLLAVACVAAFGWQTLVADPGYVLVRVGATRIETTLVFALVALLLLWGLVSLAWRLLRWPLRAWTRRTHRRGRERIASGLMALAEGRYAKAMRELERASHQTGLRAPALLAAARAAHARGETARVDAALDEAAAGAPAAALALRSRFLLEQGKADTALALLKKASAQDGGAIALPPSAQRMLAESASICADHATALEALAALAKSGQSSTSLETLQVRVLVAALSAAPDAPNLSALWTGLSRNQRALIDVVTAYARRAAALGMTLQALDELESALRRSWSERLVRAYGELGEAEADTRLRRAEGWVAAQPNSPGLMLTLGRLCIQGKIWGKARDYLERGLAIEPSAALWETLGQCCLGQDRSADAARCFSNALRIARGEKVEAIDANAPVNTRASAVEERSEHGVPRLAASRE